MEKVFKKFGMIIFKNQAVLVRPDDWIRCKKKTQVFGLNPFYLDFMSTMKPWSIFFSRFWQVNILEVMEQLFPVFPPVALIFTSWGSIHHFSL